MSENRDAHNNQSSTEESDQIYVTAFEAVAAPNRPELLRLVGLILVVDIVLPTPRFFDSLLSLDPGSTRKQLRDLQSLFKVQDKDDGYIESLQRRMDQFFFDRVRSKPLGLYLAGEKAKSDLLLQILRASMEKDESISGMSNRRSCATDAQPR